MAEALDLARRATGRTSPNPMVGAVVVRNGEVVGRGFHPRAGEPHAEIFALGEAGSLAQGGMLYVTLEPCCHWGRTGPCTGAIVEAGIARVVAAVEDPDPRVNGAGLVRLRTAGIEVTVGVLREEAERLNEAYFKHRRAGLPFVTLKWAMSLDGKIAAAPGVRTPLTGELAKQYAHELRNTHDAILVGINTILADDPQLTCRMGGGRDPLRVILDSRLRIPLEARVMNLPSTAPTLLVTTVFAPPEKMRKVCARGAEVLAFDGPQPPIRWVLQQMAARGILSVLVEGGGTVHAAVLQEHLADKIVAFVTPAIVGGANAPTPVEGPGGESSASAAVLRHSVLRQLGDDVVVEGYVGYRAAADAPTGGSAEARSA